MIRKSFLIGCARRTPQTKFLNSPSPLQFSTRKRAKASTQCPFAALRIPRKSPYKTAKQTFLKIAMQNHPDVLKQRLDESSPNYKKEMEAAVEKFMKARTAFESIVADDDGICMLRTEAEAIEETMSDDQFDAWFLNETGKSNPYQFDLDPATMREVAAATEKMGGGLDRDGGMWTLATMVSNSVKSGKEAGSTLRLEAGTIAENDNTLNVEGTLRRKRRNTRGKR